MKWKYLLPGLTFGYFEFITLTYVQGFTTITPTIITVLVDFAALVSYILAFKRFDTPLIYRSVRAPVRNRCHG